MTSTRPLTPRPLARSRSCSERTTYAHTCMCPCSHRGLRPSAERAGEQGGCAQCRPGVAPHGRDQRSHLQHQWRRRGSVLQCRRRRGLLQPRVQEGRTNRLIVRAVLAQHHPRFRRSDDDCRARRPLDEHIRGDARHDQHAQVDVFWQRYRGPLRVPRRAPLELLRLRRTSLGYSCTRLCRFHSRKRLSDHARPLLPLGF